MVAHLQFAQVNTKPKIVKELPSKRAKTDQNRQTTHDQKKQRRHNSIYPKGGVSCSKDSFVVNQTLVFQIKFSGKSPALRVGANRFSRII